MLTGKHRASIAIAAALVLTGAGVAVANGVTSPKPEAAKPSATAEATADPRAAELEKSVSDLLAQVGPLEAAVAASNVPVVPPAPAPRAATPSKSSSSASTPAPSATSDDPEPAAPAPAASTPSPTSTHEAESDEKGGSDD